MTSPPLYIGLDAGGTKTTLRAQAAPTEVGISLTGPSANLQRSGVEATARVLASLIQQALAARPDAVLGGLCAGVAGAASISDQRAVAERLRDLLGISKKTAVRITHDGTIALEAAFEGASGLIVIAGTGSVLFARTHTGVVLQTGGWGYLLGDDGSGHALGIHGLRAVAHAFDGGPPTHLQRMLADRHGLASPEAIKRRVYRDAWSVQQMAPLVIEAAEGGDAVARRIITTQTQALARQATWLTQRTDALDPRLALLGGLTRSPFYKTTLSDALSAALPGWQVQPPKHLPVVGALRLARQAPG